MSYRTKQEIFDIAYKGLRDQGFARSMDGGGSCVYRSPEGNKCAIGHLIADEDYRPEFEGRNVTNAHVARAAKIDFVTADTFGRALQRVHDNWYDGIPSSERDASLRVLAADNELTVPE